MKLIWRITPAMSGGSRAWWVHKVEKREGSEISNSFGVFKTLKAAKACIAHLKRKPIEITG